MEEEGARVAEPGKTQRQGELQRRPSKRAVPVEAVARAISAETSAAIANRIVERVEELESRQQQLQERLQKWGKGTNTHFDLAIELKYADGQIDTLRILYENFKDSKETRRGVI